MNHRGKTTVLGYGNTMADLLINEEFENATDAAYFVRRLQAPKMSEYSQLVVKSANGVVTVWSFAVVDNNDHPTWTKSTTYNRPRALMTPAEKRETAYPASAVDNTPFSIFK